MECNDMMDMLTVRMAEREGVTAVSYTHLTDTHLCILFTIIAMPAQDTIYDSEL